MNRPDRNASTFNDRDPVLNGGHAPGGSAVERALAGASDWLRAAQQPDGHWVGELEGDTILESEYFLLREFLGCLDDNRRRQLANHLRRTQLPEGGWALYPGGEPNVSSSVKAYVALRLAGLAPEHPELARARKAILRLGGVTACNTFTRIYLALFGLYDWDGTPVVPPELVLLPRWLYLNLYACSAWSRTILVPLSIISALRPRTRLPDGFHIDELFIGGRHGPHLRMPWERRVFSWRNWFLALDRCFHWCERRGGTPWRKRALATAERWVLERLEHSGGLGAIFPPLVNTLLALRALGYPDDHPTVRSQWREIEAFEIVENDRLRLQPCFSPVWDTALASLALAHAGAAPDDPALVRAAGWLLGKQSLRRGDWAVARPRAEPGGWYFEYANEFYPDVDDTAAVLMALARIRHPEQERLSDAVRRGLDWVLAMQCRGGGWASFDADNDRLIFSKVPFADHNAMLDPPTADITGRVLEMLGHYGYDTRETRVARAIQFIKRQQEPEGCWFGRWGVNYLYGTWQVLKGLRSVGEDMQAPYVRRAVEWLRSVQNPDGGWGESCDSYDDPSLKGQGPSSASQTAWAVLGLLAAGEGESEAVRRGIDHLTRAQTPDGTWDEPGFTGTGFPSVFYLRYHLYRHYFPLFALGVYARETGLAPAAPAAEPHAQEAAHALANGHRNGRRAGARRYRAARPSSDVRSPERLR